MLTVDQLINRSKEIKNLRNCDDSIISQGSIKSDVSIDMVEIFKSLSQNRSMKATAVDNQENQALFVPKPLSPHNINVNLWEKFQEITDEN